MLHSVQRIGFLAVVVLVVGFVGCSSPEPTKKTESKMTTEKMSTKTTEKMGDKMGDKMSGDKMSGDKMGDKK